MSSIEVSGRSIAINRDGFLVNFDDWDEDVAKVLADKESIQLADCHWTAIRFMRDYYDTYEVAPSPRVMIKEVGNKLHAFRCTNKTLEEIFPNGGCKQACRIAGLPVHYCHAC